jgi:thioredoxin-related protein
MLATIAIAAIVSGSLLQGTPAASHAPWDTSVAEGLKRASADNRLVLVDFWRDACPWCMKMDKVTWVDERVIAALAGIVPVKAKNTENIEEIKKYGVEGFPTIALLEPDGIVVEIHTGYMAPDELLGWLATARSRYERVRVFKERIRKDPKDMAALVGLGRIYSTEGKREEARAYLDQILKADPEGKRLETAEAHLEIGLTWRRVREYKKAVESIARARETALRLLAAGPGGAAGAKDAAAGTKDAVPAAPAGAPRPGEEPLDRILHEQAFTYRILGDRKTLLGILEEYEAKVKSPDPFRHAWVLLELGKTRLKAGSVDGAKQAFRKCDSLYPRSSEARECRENLATLK